MSERVTTSTLAEQLAGPTSCDFCDGRAVISIGNRRLCADHQDKAAEFNTHEVTAKDATVEARRKTGDE